jgi:hypothetical protein
MNPLHQQPDGGNGARTRYWLGGLTVGFLGLAGFFMATAKSAPTPLPRIPLVDVKFLATTPWRQTYVDLVKAKEDLSDYDCYACHDQKKPPVIRFDAAGKVLVPKEHSDIVMGHGSHDRNNLCYNCHNEQDLTTLQVRDGKVVKFDNIPALCGSCHGPTLRDWEAGAHGRTGGYWDRRLGEPQRLVCANCHNPHAPRIPTREPAPPPHLLHGNPATPEAAEPAH